MTPKIRDLIFETGMFLPGSESAFALQSIILDSRPLENLESSIVENELRNMERDGLIEFRNSAWRSTELGQITKLRKATFEGRLSDALALQSTMNLSDLVLGLFALPYQSELGTLPPSSISVVPIFLNEFGLDEIRACFMELVEKGLLEVFYSDRSSGFKISAKGVAHFADESRARLRLRVGQSVLEL